jgi:hypothetical protein
LNLDELIWSYVKRTGTAPPSEGYVTFGHINGRIGLALCLTELGRFEQAAALGQEANDFARRVNGPEELILLASVWDECTLTEDVLMKKGRRCRRHVRVRTTAHNGPKKPLAPNKDYVVRHRRVSWSL